jgi:hypothetical protein
MTPETFALVLSACAFLLALGCFGAAMASLIATRTMLRFLRDVMGEPEAAADAQLTEADRFRHLGSH